MVYQGERERESEKKERKNRGKEKEEEEECKGNREERERERGGNRKKVDIENKKTYELPLCFYSYERPSLYKEHQDTDSSRICADLKEKEIYSSQSSSNSPSLGRKYYKDPYLKVSV